MEYIQAKERYIRSRSCFDGHRDKYYKVGQTKCTWLSGFSSYVSLGVPEISSNVWWVKWNANETNIELFNPGRAPVAMVKRIWQALVPADIYVYVRQHQLYVSSYPAMPRSNCRPRDYYYVPADSTILLSRLSGVWGVDRMCGQGYAGNHTCRATIALSMRNGAPYWTGHRNLACDRSVARDTLLIAAFDADPTVLAADSEGFVVIRCTKCGHLARPHTQVQSQVLCGACGVKYTTCFYCGELTSKAQMVTDNVHQAVCTKCEPLVQKCIACGIWQSNVDTEGRCPSCSPNYSDLGELEHADLITEPTPSIEPDSLVRHFIHDYMHKPAPQFLPVLKPGLPTELYLGVELETDSYNNQGRLQASTLLYKVDPCEARFYQKTDASIPGGFEIVTHPATLKYHETNFPWPGIRRIVLKNGGRSHESGRCGLHVHFNSAFLKGNAPQSYDYNVLKLLHLVETFWREITRFSRRHPEHLRRFGARFFEDFRPTKEALKKFPDIRQAAQHHRAVSLVSGQTIEIRVFRGTLNLETLYATLEFVDYLVRFAKRTKTPSIHDITWKDFIAGIDPVVYPNLLPYLERRKLCASLSLKK